MGRLVERAFRRHYGEVYRFLLRRTADSGEAEELTQRVFADAAAAEEQLERDQRPLLPWLLAVAHRRWVDERRRDRRQRQALETVGADPERVGISDTELAAAIRQTLDRLPEEQREVVVRRLLLGQSFRDIAVGLGLSEGAVKMRFRRGLELLRSLLGEEGYAP
jgi:RNA polymerase sigma-70 factor (ECF subfamily)